MMQEYDDDFFFEEDKIDSNPGNSKSSLLCVDESALTNIEENHKIESDDILVEKIQEALENPDCIFNDMRKQRYMIQHQNLM